ncbi:helix-turn-helix transcriptional regulator [Streptomyces sp. NRRL S-118]|uniref:helix-turn-helix transcriptional regulator n=1 Tax=Streptomyces sp. NRRL S-118 TaxID=1463881 RepID=UPI0004CC0F6C|nr:hypothetical protein [Streptomyces sp. NRRL S-118]
MSVEVPVLSAAARALYARITRGEPAGHADGAALDELVDWHLVAVDPDGARAPIALDPQEAGRRRLDDELRDMAARAARTAAIPALADELGVHFERAKWRSGSSSEFLAEPEQVDARIGEAVGGAETELWTARPRRPRSPELIESTMAHEAEALARGVHVRTLCHDSERDDPRTRAWVTAMTAQGGRFRTLAAPFQQCVVVDRRQAFIPDHVVNSSPSHAAWHVVDRALVAYIAEGFAEAWRRADIWHGDPEPGRPDDGGSGLTRRQREILMDTAAGIDQRITARRLGIGLRTLSKELGDLRARWGVSTLAALSYQWALSAERQQPHHDDPATGARSGTGSAPGP